MQRIPLESVRDAGGEGPGPGPPPDAAALPEAGREEGADLRRTGGHALILANRLPFPLDDGWKVRTFHIMRGIARALPSTALVFHPARDVVTIAAARAALGPDVDLVTIEPPRAYTPLNLLRGMFTRLPVHVWNQESAGMRRALRAALAKGPEVVIAESTFMARYLDLLPPGVPRVVDTHNIDSITFRRYVASLRSGPRRWYAAATVRRLKTLEAATFAKATGVWVCSEEERELAQRSAPSGRVWLVPNGVDTSYFAPTDQAPRASNSLLFFGRLDYFPNVDGLQYFVHEILPLIAGRRPGVTLDIVGAGTGREVRELAARHPSLRLVGRVPDLRALLDTAGVVVVPLRVGGGTRLKILEALAMARPVVSTSVGAEGLAVRGDQHLMLADTPQRFADAVISLLEHPEQAKRLGEQGRDLVCQHYDWGHIGRIVARSLSVVTASGSRE
jgi:glycosyltransferase involved in cell wall biosynthesis